MVTGTHVLVVMRDHAGIGGVSGGKLCLCGEAFLTPLEHTVHVADAIADAVRRRLRDRDARARAQAAPRRDGRQLLPAGELDLEHLGLRVVVPVPGIGDAGGLLLRCEDDGAHPDLVEVELLPPGDGPPVSYPVNRGSWVEVYRR